MKRFVCKIGIYLLPIVLLIILLECMVERIPNSYEYKRLYMESHAADIQTLIMGHSVAYDGIDPSELRNAFNLANSSQCLEDDYRLLARYIDKMDSLKYVILPLSYSSLQMVSSSNRRGYYTIYMDLYPRWPISKYSFEFFNLELMAKKIAKTILYSEDLVRCDSLGMRVGHTIENRDKEDWKQVKQLIKNDQFTGGASLQYIEQNIKYLENIVTCCRKHGVELILIAMPMMHEYQQGIAKEQIQTMETAMRDAYMKNDNVRIYDMQTWGDENDFWNATHLNRNGAKRLTKEINKILEWNVKEYQYNK